MVAIVGTFQVRNTLCEDICVQYQEVLRAHRSVRENGGSIWLQLRGVYYITLQHPSSKPLSRISSVFHCSQTCLQLRNLRFTHLMTTSPRERLIRRLKRQLNCLVYSPNLFSIHFDLDARRFDLLVRPFHKSSRYSISNLRCLLLKTCYIVLHYVETGYPPPTSDLQVAQVSPPALQLLSFSSLASFMVHL